MDHRGEAVEHLTEGARIIAIVTVTVDGTPVRERVAVRVALIGEAGMVVATAKDGLSEVVRSFEFRSIGRGTWHLRFHLLLFFVGIMSPSTVVACRFKA